MVVSYFYHVAAAPFGAGFSMANPSVFRAEHSMAPDLSSERSVFHGGSSSTSRRRDLVFVVNPRGANGRTGKEWKKLLPYLQSRLGSGCNDLVHLLCRKIKGDGEVYICRKLFPKSSVPTVTQEICESLTSGPSHATDITREAIKEGVDAVIAVGGDGTLHEIVNGFFWDDKPVANQNLEVVHSTAIGLIPLGTGSDFSRTLGWKNDPFEAIERIARGVRSRIDVGVISREGEASHYFINVADIHLSAKAGYYASRYKKFGNLCYVIGALQAFIGHRNLDLRIKVNEGDWQTYSQVTAMCIGNAKYFGGGMKITPNADPQSGSFEVVILQNFKWYDFILKLHKLYSGTHLSVKNVTSRSVYSIEVEDISNSSQIFIQSDGEHLGFLPRKLCILPGAIEMIC